MKGILEVLWFVLKGSGMFLLLLLGLVLILLLLVLLVPIRYRARVKKEEVPENAVSAEGLVSWLDPLVRVRLRFAEKKLCYTVRVFGICLTDSEKPGKRTKKKTKKKTKKAQRTKKDKKKKEKGAEPEKECRSVTVPADSGKLPAEEMLQLPGTAEAEKGRKTEKSFLTWWKGLFKKIKEFPSKIREKVRRLWRRIRLLWKKKEAAASFFEDEQHRLAVGKAVKAVKALAGHCLPRKLKGCVEFGTGDPESTGKALAVLGIAYGIYGKKLTVIPDFYEKRVVADVSFRGRIRTGTVLRMVWHLIRDEQIKAFYKDWKQFTEGLREKAE